MSESRLPSLVRAIIERCRSGETLCKTIIHTPDGRHIEKYHFEPSLDSVPPVWSQKAIASGLLVANPDGLLGDGNSQTWRAKE